MEPLILSGLFLLTIVTPVFFWLWFLRVCDRSEPEAKKNLIRIFFIGAGAAIFAAAIESTLFSLIAPQQTLKLAALIPEALPLSFAAVIIILLGLITGALVEELVKAGTFWEFVYPKPYFNQVADGVFYAMALALGFSVFENILYFFALAKQLDSTTFAAVVLLRSVASTFIHLSCTGLIGYGLAKRKFGVNHSNLVALKFMAAAVSIHFIFNASLMITAGIWIAFLISFVSLLLLFKTLTKPDSRWIWRKVKDNS